MSCKGMMISALWLCVLFTSSLQADEEIKNNTVSKQSRSPRYGLDDYKSRLPYNADYQSRYYDPSSPYPEFGAKPDRYDVLPYEVPSGFDQFVPDKSDSKYTYGPGGFYLPYPPNVRPDYVVESIEEKNDDKTTNPSSIFKDGTSKVKDMVDKAVKVISGTSEVGAVETEENPSFLTVIRNYFKDPIVSITTLVVSMTFVFATLLPFLTKFLTTTGMLPAITSTIANTVARNLDVGNSIPVEQILDVLNEYGARAIEDPRCFQRFLCQAAKSQIESRNGDSWSIYKAIQKLAKIVDGKLAEAVGLNLFMTSVQSGSCEKMPCSGSSAYSQDNSLMDKIRLLAAKIFNYTEVIQ